MNTATRTLPTRPTFNPRSVLAESAERYVTAFYAPGPMNTVPQRAALAAQDFIDDTAGPGRLTGSTVFYARTLAGGTLAGFVTADGGFVQTFGTPGVTLPAATLADLAVESETNPGEPFFRTVPDPRTGETVFVDAYLIS
jgi:hypothetical protein